MYTNNMKLKIVIQKQIVITNTNSWIYYTFFAIRDDCYVEQFSFTSQTMVLIFAL